MWLISLYFSNGRYADSSWAIIYFQESLLKILKLVLVPSPSSVSEESRSLFGACHGSAMVGCPFSKDTAAIPLWIRLMGIYWFCDLVISCSFIMLVLLIPPWLLRWHTCGDHFLETMLILMLKRIPVPMDISVRKLNAVRHFGSYGCGCILQLLMKDSMFWVLPVRSWYLWTKCSLIISLSNFYFIYLFFI